jgi:hypothetical protein
MTSTAEGSGDTPASRIARLRMFIGHYAGKISAWLSLIFSIRIVLGVWFPDLIRPWSLAFLIVFIVTLALITWGGHAHRRALCEREKDDIALVLDPQAAVDKNLRRLKAYHLFTTTRLGSNVTWAVCGTVFVALLLINHLWPLAGDIVATVLISAASPLVFYLDLATMTHRRLSPWCPYCRHGGRGPRRTHRVPTPDPVGQKTT